MIYWHIQMYKPEGRDSNVTISSLDMLTEPKPVIGTGEWEDIQCDYFKGTNPNGLKIGDIVLIHEGKKPIALCEIRSDNFCDEFLESKYVNTNFRYVKVLEFYRGNDSFKDHQGTIKRLINREKDSWKFINQWYHTIKKTMIVNNIKKVLNFKKQIILQGPPGTGKTRLAKTIAREIIETIINFDVISKVLKVGQKINSPSGNKFYVITELDKSKDRIKLKRESGTEDYTSLDEIVKAFNSKLWDEPLEQNGPRRAESLAKYLFNNLDMLKDSKQFNIVQFHPSYTYEDFVRGIEATSKGDSIEYRSVNKTIGEIAKEALKNYKLSKDSSSQSNIEAWIDTSFEEFKNEIEAKLPETETELSGEITIFEVQKSHFKYAKQWQTPGYLKFDEFKKLIKAVIQGSLELSNRQLDKEKFIHAHYRYTYYNALLKKFFKEFEYKEESIKVEAKKYVLIIDEINRANLSSVLGELVYALEYRGQSVNSMYEVDDSKALNLPPNLYIIGTMNTADRSVGHIDYAIRRRFAFIDVLPRDLSDDSSIIFHKELFNSVAALFTKDDNYKSKSDYISEEFEPKDVALGHSYFIDQSKDGGTMDIRLEYEIKPILLEYIKDGILKETAKAEIEKLKVS